MDVDEHDPRTGVGRLINERAFNRNFTVLKTAFNVPTLLPSSPSSRKTEHEASSMRGRTERELEVPQTNARKIS